MICLFRECGTTVLADRIATDDRPPPLLVRPVIALLARRSALGMVFPIHPPAISFGMLKAIAAVHCILRAVWVATNRRQFIGHSYTPLVVCPPLHRSLVQMQSIPPMQRCLLRVSPIDFGADSQNQIKSMRCRIAAGSRPIRFVSARRSRASVPVASVRSSCRTIQSRNVPHSRTARFVRGSGRDRFGRPAGACSAGASLTCRALSHILYSSAVIMTLSPQLAPLSRPTEKWDSRWDGTGQCPGTGQTCPVKSCDKFRPVSFSRPCNLSHPRARSVCIPVNTL